ncbi:MAG TPA: hypothetical protein VJ302_06585 [Blastocatellia bacterium]|nr:hypothetical protein [Blastocatellia bacterium]
MQHPLHSPSLAIVRLVSAFTLSLALAGALLPPTVKADGPPTRSPKFKGSDKGSKAGKKKSKKGAPTEPGIPTLWKDRGSFSQLNLFWGIGSEEGRPKPPFRFDKEDLSGSNPKLKVIDANKVKWNLKFDEEVHAEIAATRLAWACGYMVEESYFVPSGQIVGITALTRAKDFVAADGSFTNGMFEKRPDEIARRGINWSWNSNPFKGSRELSGLAMINCLLNNWDAKVENNNVLGMYDEEGQVRDWYLITDWGGTFGKTGGFTSRSKNKWNLEDYSKHDLIEEVKSKSVKFRYAGKMAGALRTVPREHVRWFSGIIGQLTDNQLRDAFRAAGATPIEMEGFSKQVRSRINELKAATEK